MPFTAPPGSELAGQLERTFRLLGKRIYRPSARRSYGGLPSVDYSSIPILAMLESGEEPRFLLRWLGW